MLQKLQDTKKAICDYEAATNQQKQELLALSLNAVAISPFNKSLEAFLNTLRALEKELNAVLEAVNENSAGRTRLHANLTLRLELNSAEGYHIYFEDFLAPHNPLVRISTAYKKNSLSFFLWLKLANDAETKEAIVLYEGYLKSDLPEEFSRQQIIDHFSGLDLIFNDFPKAHDNLISKHFDEPIALYTEDNQFNLEKLWTLLTYFKELTYQYFDY